ncbi:MAG: thioredoxin family protein [Aureispira sp.]|nr:thioredoxin family protein [Aureispira sp.]
MMINLDFSEYSSKKSIITAIYNQMVNIKIFGVGSSRYNRILQNLFKAKDLLAIPVLVEEINDIDAIMAHNVDAIPSLMINDNYYHNIDSHTVSELIGLIEDTSDNI